MTDGYCRTSAGSDFRLDEPVITSGVSLAAGGGGSEGGAMHVLEAVRAVYTFLSSSFAKW